MIYTFKVITSTATMAQVIIIFLSLKFINTLFSKYELFFPPPSLDVLPTEIKALSTSKHFSKCTSIRVYTKKQPEHGTLDSATTLFFKGKTAMSA